MRPIDMRVRAVVIAALAFGLVTGCGGPGHPADRSAAPAPTSAPASPPAAPSPGGSTAPVTPPNLPPNTGTGITGVTLVVGGCPVQRDDQPCRERPVSATLAIIDPATNAVVTTVTSGADGVFRVTTAPGRYLVRSATPTGPLMSHVLPVAVEVQAGHYANVTIRFESGIR